MEKHMNRLIYSLQKLRVGAFCCICLLGMGCAPLGTRPSDEDVKRFTSSKNYNAETNQFQNRIPNVMELMNKRIYNWDSIKEWFKGPEQGRPPQRLPVGAADLNLFKTKTAPSRSFGWGIRAFCWP